jgi:uncharacterized membrane protein YphA (DoxX/SURF4 family)
LINSGAYIWFSNVIVLGELAVGIALTVGAFTSLATLGGAFMNWNYCLTPIA